MSRRLMAALLLSVLTLGVLLLLRLPTHYADFVAEMVSRPMGRVLSGASSRIPFPVGELTSIALALGIAFGAARGFALSIIGKSIRPLSGYCKNLALLTSVIALGYALLWAPLYYVEPLSSRLGFEQGGQYTLSELTELCRDLTESANRLREDLPDTLPPYAQGELIERAQTVLSENRVLTLETKPVKAIRYPELLRALDIAGVYFPWTGESIVSGCELPISLPFLFTHESAHQAGFAREDEANYIAYLACADGDTYFQYSGAMYALYYAMEALHDADTVSWSTARMLMSEAVQGDYYRMNGLRNAQVPRFTTLKAEVSTAFLRISRQTGARSYGDMVDLLLAHRRAALIRVNP